jgi:ribosomal protein S18 acetylase RimI-like enzyme
VTETISIGPISAIHRTQIEEIIRATRVFSDAEIGVALEVFDAATTTDMGHGTSEMERTLSHAPMSHVPSPMSDYEVLGAFAGDVLIGYACFGATPATDRTYDLYWIAVHPEAQGSGAGSALLSEIERRLESRPARLLVIETSSREDYEHTRHFYHNRGYHEAARLRDFYAPGDDRVVLSKRLVASSEPAATLPPILFPSTI